MKYTVIVDGPNLISRLIKNGLDKDLIANNFSLRKLLVNGIRDAWQQEFGPQPSIGLEFIHSTKIPGPEGDKLTKDQWSKFLGRTPNEDAVTLTEIAIPSNNEKGVDVAVAVRLIEAAEICELVCLVSSDKDYIPVLEYLKRKGRYVCTVGFAKSHPIELRNLSYLFIDIGNYIKKEYS